MHWCIFSPGDPLHLDPAVADGVLPPAGRDHSADVAGRAPARKVPALHNDTRHALNLRHRWRAQRALQVRLLSFKLQI